MTRRAALVGFGAIVAVACGGEDVTAPDAAQERAGRVDTSSALGRSVRAAAASGSGSAFELDPGAQVGELLGQVSIALPSERDTSGTAVLFPPDSTAPVEGPVIVEVAGRIDIGGGEGRVSDLVDRGLVGWQTTDGRQMVRPASLTFLDVTSDGAASSGRGVAYDGAPRDSFRLRGTSAAGQGLAVSWDWEESFDRGPAGEFDDGQEECLVLSFVICLEAGGRDLQESETPPSGIVRVRAYRAGDSASVSIDSIGTRNVSSAGAPTFTTLRDEADVTVAASTMPDSFMSEVKWEVRPVSTDVGTPRAPGDGALEQGERITWSVPEQDAGRMERFPHPGTVEQKALAFEVVASVATGEEDTVTSEPDTVRQDEVDTVREEYVELRHARGVPMRGEFETEQRGSTGRNTGDYGVAIVDGTFEAQLHDVRQRFGLDRPWQINSIYRNPVHQRVHLRGDPDSFHQDGCAVDLQTFPKRGADGEFDSPEQRRLARDYWDQLAAAGKQTDLEVEAIEKSRVGHVHLERDPCLESNNRPFP